MHWAISNQLVSVVVLTIALWTVLCQCVTAQSSNVIALIPPRPPKQDSSAPDIPCGFYGSLRIGDLLATKVARDGHEEVLCYNLNKRRIEWRILLKEKNEIAFQPVIEYRLSLNFQNKITVRSYREYLIINPESGSIDYRISGRDVIGDLSIGSNYCYISIDQNKGAIECRRIDNSTVVWSSPIATNADTMLSSIRVIGTHILGHLSARSYVGNSMVVGKGFCLNGINGDVLWEREMVRTDKSVDSNSFSINYNNIDEKSQLTIIEHFSGKSIYEKSFALSIASATFMGSNILVVLKNESRSSFLVCIIDYKADLILSKISFDSMDANGYVRSIIGDQIVLGRGQVIYPKKSPKWT
jgi:hypothetical protein